MKRVLLDCDGVLANFTRGYLNAIREITGIQYREEDANQWRLVECDFFKDAARQMCWSVEDLKEEVAEICHAEGFCENLEVIPGAKEAVSLLKKMATVYCVTAPWDSKTWSYERLRWLQEHFGFEKQDIVITPAKELVYGDVLVDDRASHIKAWTQAWPASHGVLFDAPQNRNDGLTHLRGGWELVFRRVIT